MLHQRAWNCNKFVDEKSLTESRGTRVTTGQLFYDYNIFWYHISTKNFKASSIWVTSLIYPTFNLFIVDVGLNHSHLTQQSPSQVWVFHFLYLHCHYSQRDIPLDYTVKKTFHTTIIYQDPFSLPTKLNHGSDITCWEV